MLSLLLLCCLCLCEFAPVLDWPTCQLSWMASWLLALMSLLRQDTMGSAPARHQIESVHESEWLNGSLGWTCLALSVSLPADACLSQCPATWWTRFVDQPTELSFPSARRPLLAAGGERVVGIGAGTEAGKRQRGRETERGREAQRRRERERKAERNKLQRTDCTTIALTGNSSPTVSLKHLNS